MTFEERRKRAIAAAETSDWSVDAILDAFGGREHYEEVEQWQGLYEKACEFAAMREQKLQEEVDRRKATVETLRIRLLGWDEVSDERDQLRVEVERLTSERDKAREECGHERHMRGFNSEERDKWVRKFIEGEAERDQLRGEVERLKGEVEKCQNKYTQRGLELFRLRASLEAAIAFIEELRRDIPDWDWEERSAFDARIRSWRVTRSTDNQGADDR